MIRRKFIGGLLGLVSAPALVRAEALMPVSVQPALWSAPWPPVGTMLYCLASQPIPPGWRLRERIPFFPLLAPHGFTPICIIERVS